MKRAIFLLIFAICISAQCFGHPLPAADTRDESEVRQFVNDFAAAFQNNDADALDRLFAADYVFVTPSGAIQNKQQRVLEVRSGDRKYELAKYDEVTVHMYGSTAVVTARVTIKAKNKGVDANGQFQALLTIVKIKGKWQLVASQANVLPQI